MVRHNKEGFLAQSQTLALHCGSCHFKGFPSPDFVCKQRISPIKYMSDGILLMLTEGNIRIHTAKTNMAAVILTRSGGIKQFIVFCDQSFTPVRFFPYPVLKSILYRLLFLLCERCLLFIQDTLLLSIRILYRIIDTNIFQIQCFFQNAVRIGSVRSISCICCHIIVARRTFPIDTPFCRHFRKFNFNGSTQIIRRFKSFLHKLLNISRFNPCRTQTDIYFRCVQIFRLSFLKCLYIDTKRRIFISCKLCNSQFTSHISRKILIRRLPAFFHCFRSHWVLKNNPFQFFRNTLIFLRRSKQFCHIRQIYTAMLSNGNCKCFGRRIYTGYSAFRFNRSLAKHIGFTFQISIFIHIFQRTKKIIRRIFRKSLSVSSVID